MAIACSAQTTTEPGAPEAPPVAQTETSSYDDATTATTARTETGFRAVLKDAQGRELATLEWAPAGAKEGRLTAGPGLVVPGITDEEITRPEPTFANMNDSVHALWRMRPQGEVGYRNPDCNSCYWNCIFWVWDASSASCALGCGC